MFAMTSMASLMTPATSRTQSSHRASLSFFRARTSANLTACPRSSMAARSGDTPGGGKGCGSNTER